MPAANLLSNSTNAVFSSSLASTTSTIDLNLEYLIDGSANGRAAAVSCSNSSTRSFFRSIILAYSNLLSGIVVCLFFAFFSVGLLQGHLRRLHLLRRLRLVLQGKVKAAANGAYSGDLLQGNCIQMSHPRSSQRKRVPLSIHWAFRMIMFHMKQISSLSICSWVNRPI